MLCFSLFILARLAFSQLLTINPPTCTPTPPPSNNCPSKFGVCTWWGDPHVVTFDKFYHGFQGFAGERYRYVSPCDSDFVRVPFQVLAKHRVCNWVPFPWFTCTEYVDIRLHDASGNYLFSLRIEKNGGGGAATVKSFTEPGPYTLSANIPDGTYAYANGKYTVRRWSIYTQVIIRTNNLCPNGRPNRPDLRVRVNNWIGQVRVVLNEYYKKAVCGLCGYWDGDSKNDFLVHHSGFGVCFQFNAAGVWGTMAGYPGINWWILQWFGSFWRDLGVGIRRLADIDFDVDNPPQDELPPSPDGEPAEIPPLDEEKLAFSNEVQAKCEERFGDCFDCVGLGGEASIGMEECNNDVEQCIERFCMDACFCDNCVDLCQLPPEATDGGQ